MVSHSPKNTEGDVVEKIQKPLGNHVKNTSFLSIKESLFSAKEKKESINDLDYSEKPKDDFTEGQILCFWTQYLESLRNHQPVLYNVLNTTTCLVKENHTVFFEFPSNSAYDEFENLKEDIFQKLKKQVNNFSINFEFEIKETQKTILLSSRDKFDKMVKINPLLDKLKNDFRLDI